MNQLKIPEDRVGCLIGKAGSTKKLVERKTNCKLKVSKEGDVLITGEALDAFVCHSVIRAIGRGFNPNVALKLVKEDHALVVISIREVSGKSQKNIMQSLLEIFPSLLIFLLSLFLPFLLCAVRPALQEHKMLHLLNRLLPLINS